ncbi:MAG: ABC transporter substrate-binding protein [Gammaproteobacteria bacterium]|nr:ABC transporter substrate-binding protein [Gammaproteobacteria bacterium]
MKIAYHLSALIGLLCWALATQALAAPAPKERVQDTVDAVLEVLRDETRDVETKKRDIRVLVRERFDFRAMAQSTLAQNWRSASEEEQKRFVDLYSRLLEDTYLVMVEEYTNETVEYRNEILRNENNAQVDTAILAADKEIPVVYRTRLKDGDWYIYDVIIEGVSLISNYRSTYQQIVRREGMDGLLARLEEKTGCADGNC